MQENEERMCLTGDREDWKRAESIDFIKAKKGMWLTMTSAIKGHLSSGLEIFQ